MTGTPVNSVIDRFIPPPPGDALMRCIDDFDRYLGEGPRAGSLSPLVLSYIAHYQFEAIHPFLDGNGRIGRLLLALTTFKWSELHLPWLYMSAYFERYKDEYVDNMFRVSTHGDWERWIEFCLRGTAEQCRDAIRRCDALNKLRAEMHERLGSFPRLNHVVEQVFVKPVFTTKDVAHWCDISMPTARRDIEQMMAAGFVRHLTGARPKSYYVPPIFAAAYSEGENHPEGDSQEGPPVDVKPDDGADEEIY
jgi:Fic family protein